MVTIRKKTNEGNEKQMTAKSKEMRRDIKQMNTAQLSSAQLTRKANEYKN